jgi:acyl carrier protein phosphodiesterase
MNYLAHLFLAGDDAESLIGNLAGDFVKGALHDRFTPAIRQGIVKHRRIDAFTDSHPSVAAFRRVLIPEHGHWSRVIADVFFDYFLAADFDYEYMINEIISQIKTTCNNEGVDEPDIFTEFGSYTVGESGCVMFSVLGVKNQNDRETWYMLDGSLMNNLPDIWGLSQRFIMLPININLPIIL